MNTSDQAAGTEFVPAAVQRFSPAVSHYLESHAVDLDLAWRLGVRSDRDAPVYPVTTPRGDTYTRRRDLATRITRQPRNQPLILWWPAGRPDPGADVLLTEGEPDALAALSALNGDGIAIAALPGTEIPAERVTAELAAAETVYLALDGDDAGRKAADRLARALQHFTCLKVVKLGEGEDLASRLHGEEDRAGWLRAALETAPEAPKLKLKKAEPEGYGREKKADRLRDLRAKGIDPDTIDLGELLSDIKGFIHRYVFLSDTQAAAIALWVVHTHTFEASRVTPYLSISSAEPGSGKTLLLEVLALLVPRPWLTGRTTAAVLPRKIEVVTPTLLLDESDTAFRGDKDYAAALHGILNTGYKRSGASTVCVGQGANIDFRDFSTYCPKAFAGIGQLPDTVRARSFAIRLEKIADEQVEEFDEEDAEQAAAALCDRLEGFTLRGVDQLRGARPERPPGLSPRTKEISRPLLAIAELAGGDWPVMARRALAELGGAGVTEDESIGVELLSDIRDVFESRDVDRISTADLLEALVDMEERPWCEWSKGKPIASRGVARLLKPYGIHSRAVRLADGTRRKGLQRDQLEDAWKRHIPHTPVSIGDSVTMALPSQKQPVPIRDTPPAVTDRKSSQTASQSQCHAVTDRTPVMREGGGSATLEADGESSLVWDFTRPRDERDSAEAEAAGIALAQTLVDAGEAEWVRIGPPRRPAICRWPSHRVSDYAAPGGRLICGTCHPLAEGSA